MKITGLLALLTLAAACDAAPAVVVVASTDCGDAAVDASPDVAEDTAPDLAPDSAPDVTPDATPDAPPSTCPAPGAAGTISVGPGDSLQAAVNASITGTVIYVAAGTYAPFVVNGKAPAICCDPGVSIVGTGPGSAVVRFTASTTQAPTAPVASMHGPCVVKGGGPGIQVSGPPVLLEGVIVEDNTTSGSTAGGGIQFAQSAPWPFSPALTLRNVTIRRNSGHTGGGLVASMAAANALTIEDSTIEDNIARGGDGGGVNVTGGSPVVTGSAFRRNSLSVVYANGGAFTFARQSNCSPASATFRENVFESNTAPSHTGGVFVDEGATATFTRDLFVGNAGGTVGGGAIGVDGGSCGRSAITVDGVVFVGNGSAGKPGAAVLLRASSGTAAGSSDATVRNSIARDNVGTDYSPSGVGSVIGVSYGIHQTSSGGGTLTLGPGVQVGADPLFGADYHLGAGSPGINAGDPASSCSVEPNGCPVDLGRWGGTASAP